jgi:hypothetical protein
MVLSDKRAKSVPAKHAGTAEIRHRRFRKGAELISVFSEDWIFRGNAMVTSGLSGQHLRQGV